MLHLLKNIITICFKAIVCDEGSNLIHLSSQITLNDFEKTNHQEQAIETATLTGSVACFLKETNTVNSTVETNPDVVDETVATVRKEDDDFFQAPYDLSDIEKEIDCLDGDLAKLQFSKSFTTIRQGKEFGFNRIDIEKINFNDNDLYVINENRKPIEKLNIAIGM